MDGSTALAIGGLCTGIAGCLTAYAAIVKARGDSHTECHDQLKAARAEAEEYAHQLHQERIAHDMNAMKTITLFVIAAVLLVSSVVMTAASAYDNGKQDTPTEIVAEPGPQGPPGEPGTDGTDGQDGETITGPPGERSPDHPAPTAHPATTARHIAGPAGEPGAASNVPAHPDPNPANPSSAHKANPDRQGAPSDIPGPQGIQGVQAPPEAPDHPDPKANPDHAEPPAPSSATPASNPSPSSSKTSTADNGPSSSAANHSPHNTDGASVAVHTPPKRQRRHRTYELPTRTLVLPSNHHRQIPPPTPQDFHPPVPQDRRQGATTRSDSSLPKPSPGTRSTITTPSQKKRRPSWRTYPLLFAATLMLTAATIPDGEPADPVQPVEMRFRQQADQEATTFLRDARDAYALVGYLESIKPPPPAPPPERATTRTVSAPTSPTPSSPEPGGATAGAEATSHPAPS